MIKCQWICARSVVCGSLYDYMFGSKCVYSAVCGRAYDLRCFDVCLISIVWTCV